MSPSTPRTMIKLKQFPEIRPPARRACAVHWQLPLLLLAMLIALPVIAAETSYSEAFRAYEEKRYDEAFTLLLPLAEQGEGQAQMAVSLLYERGLGVARDIDKAMYWYEKAALRGDPMIQNELGLKYFNGDGIPHDYDRAATWWLKAAASGHVEAQYSLALMYVNGTGFTKNIDMAMKWLNKASAQDYGPADYSLGVIFATGNGVTRDYKRAFEYFGKAAAQGIVEAQYNLGVCYEKGRGTPVDLQLAKTWYRKAAAQGFARAQAKLVPEALAPEKLAPKKPAPAIAAPAPAEAASELPPAVTDPEPDASEGHVLADAATPESTATTDVTLHRADWLAKQNPDAYALQLVVVSSLESVTRFFDKFHIERPKAYYTIQRDGKVLYRVVCGVFKSIAEAQQASVQLGEQLTGLKPVIVRYSAIHAALAD